jgi:preprotein translocase subunit SecA
MTASPVNELYHIFEARRVKAPELKGLDTFASAAVGWVKHKTPVLPNLRKFSAAVDSKEADVKKLGSTAFKEEVGRLRDLARRGRLEKSTDDLATAYALVREAAIRTIEKRPFPVQIMGARAMTLGYVAEMATGEGKTLTAALAAAVWAWHGRPVHVITVNDYLVARDAELNKPLYEMLGVSVGSITHETTPQQRFGIYRGGVVYVTSKELVADFLRDQILLGEQRSSASTAVGLMTGKRQQLCLVPGLFRCIADEADSLLIDEAVTPLIISNSPDGNVNEPLYREARDLAAGLEEHRDFKVDRVDRKVELTSRGKLRLAGLSDDMVAAQLSKAEASDGEIEPLDEVAEQAMVGRRRREELVVQALVAEHCFQLDEQYLIDKEGKICIIDEGTGRVMPDRSWRGGLHQAIEIKESVEVTSDKENLARLSFQRFFRSYPVMAGMTGTAWEARNELWQIFERPVVRIPTNKPCVRQQLPLRFFTKADDKWDAVADRVAELHAEDRPVLIGTRSVWSSETVAKKLAERGLPHRVLNARQDAQEAEIVAQAGKAGAITVATNMAGRGTDILLSDDVKKRGGLNVIATEPHTSSRVDRQLFGRAARQGDPGSAQMFASAEDDLLKRHAPKLRHRWRAVGAARVIRVAQERAERLGRFNRKSVLRSDTWMDQSLPF